MFIVIDRFQADYPTILVDPDKDYAPMLFDTHKEAEAFSKEECQNGLVVDLQSTSPKCSSCKSERVTVICNDCGFTHYM